MLSNRPIMTGVMLGPVGHSWPYSNGGAYLPPHSFLPHPAYSGYPPFNPYNRPYFPYSYPPVYEPKAYTQTNTAPQAVLSRNPIGSSAASSAFAQKKLLSSPTQPASLNASETILTDGMADNIDKNVKPNSKTLLYAGGALALSAAVIGGILYAQRTQANSKVESKKPVLPLYKLEDFKVPPGLETPEKRRKKSVELANLIYPEIIKRYEKNPNSAEWAHEVNEIFNSLLRSRVYDKGRVNFIVNYGIFVPGEYGGRYEPALKPKYVKDTYLSNMASLELISYAGLIKFNKSHVQKAVSQSEANMPCFYLGQIEIKPSLKPSDDEGKSKLYSLIVHETNHFLFELANHPLKMRKALETILQSPFKKALVLDDWETMLFNQILAHYKLETIPKDAKLSQERVEKYWQVFTRLASDPTHKYPLISQWKDKDIIFNQCPRDKLKALLKVKYLNEYEAYLTYKERFRSENCSAKKVFLHDLVSGLRAMMFRDVIDFVEAEILKLPEDQRHNLAQKESILVRPEKGNDAL